jgi:hypothetical protein
VGKEKGEKDGGGGYRENGGIEVSCLHADIKRKRQSERERSSICLGLKWTTTSKTKERQKVGVSIKRRTAANARLLK